MEDSSQQAGPSCTAVELRELFIFYLNGKATEDEGTRIEQHLMQCDRCRQALRLLKLVKDIERHEK